MQGPEIKRLELAATVVALLSLEPLMAQGAQGADRAHAGVLEEIIVTARRRDEPLMAIPMSLTRLNGAALDNLQFRDLDEFLSLSPGVLAHSGGDGVSPMITIRGVVSPGELIEPGNSVYVDEVYASGMRTVLPRFYDIESVQVLKGPQAGLYGRNTLGGAVLITTGQPVAERFARLDASYAQFGALDLNGTANSPLSDWVLLRATAWYNDVDGGYYQSGLFDQNLDASSETGGRVTLAVLPNQRTLFTLTGEFADIDDTDVPVIGGFAGVVDGARLGPAPLPAESRHHVLRDDLGGRSQDLARINGKFELDMDIGTVVAVAGWREVKVNDPGSDFDGTAFAASYTEFLADPSHPLATPSPEVYSRDDSDTALVGEIRYLTSDTASPLRMQTGVSYFQETLKFSDQVAPAGDFALILDDIGQDGSFTRRVEQDSSSWAGYTELIWTPVATVELTADLRYTHEGKDLDFQQAASGFYSRPNFPNVDLDANESFNNWSPGISLAYMPGSTLTVFGKYVRGFRAGGFNMLVNDPARLPYDSEEAENYEVGVNLLLLDQRLQLGASVFYLRIDNALAPVEDPGELANFYPLQNGAVAETTGLEVDLAAQLTEQLSLTASAGAYDNSIADGGFFGGDKRAYAPDYTAGLLANYEHPLTPSLTGIATLGFRHRSGGRVPAAYEIDMDSYNLLDAQVGFRVGKVQLAGFVRNALDDHYIIGNFGLAFGQYAYVTEPGTRALVRDPGRVFGVRLTILL